MLAPPGVESTRREEGQGPSVVHLRSSTTAVASEYMGAPRVNVSPAPACPVGPQPDVHTALWSAVHGAVHGVRLRGRVCRTLMGSSTCPDLAP